MRKEVEARHEKHGEDATDPMQFKSFPSFAHERLALLSRGDGPPFGSFGSATFQEVR
jgi:hypothetical protein